MLIKPAFVIETLVTVITSKLLTLETGRSEKLNAYAHNWHGERTLTLHHRNMHCRAHTPTRCLRCALSWNETQVRNRCDSGSVVVKSLWCLEVWRLHTSLAQWRNYIYHYCLYFMSKWIRVAPVNSGSLVILGQPMKTPRRGGGGIYFTLKDFLSPFLIIGLGAVS